MSLLLRALNLAARTEQFETELKAAGGKESVEQLLDREGGAY